MKALVRRILRRYGYDVVRYTGRFDPSVLPADVTDDEGKIYEAVAGFTMTGVERIVTLIRATEYIVKNRIEGDIAECGVWRGGSMMAVAYTLLGLGDTTRCLYLYDTFSGMPPPTDDDKRVDGTPAADLLKATPRKTGLWCYSTAEDVRKNLLSTGYPASQIRLVSGVVEETIPTARPHAISLLRLDTDWYESTKHELTHLYPLLARMGILIIDDYGFWQGTKKATDEYFEQFATRPLLQRIDMTGRLVVKPD